MSLRALVVDPFPAGPLAELRALGLDVAYLPGLGDAGLLREISGAGILIVRSTAVGAAAIDAARRLNLIVRAGAGVNTIDVSAASRRGIYVANCPGKNATAVAELTLGLILALDRRLPEATASVRAGKWDKREFGKARGLSGRTIGIAGLGAIGRAVASRARAFELVPHAWSRTLTPERAREAGVEYAASLRELASRSEILTLHLPLTVETRRVVDRHVLEALPHGAMLINTARAEIIDEEALHELVVAKGLRFGADVLEAEPKGTGMEVASPLLGLPGVHVTPHIGASTEQAQTAIATETVRIVRAFLLTGSVPNVVNVTATSPAQHQLVVRHLDRVGVLASVLSVLKQHQINVEELTNTVFDGAVAACATMRLAGAVSPTCLDEISALADVLHVDCVPLRS